MRRDLESFYERGMSMGRGVLLIAAAFIACKEEKEHAPGAAPPSNVPAPSVAVSGSSSVQTAILPNVPSAASVSPSPAPMDAAAAPAPSVSVATSVPASTSASAPGPLASKLVGYWMFAKFDLTDAATASKWNAIPEAMQKEILAEAPKATIEFTKDKLVSRLTGVPDKVSTWTVDSEDPTDLVIKTSDEGRKKIRFVTPDQIRIEELDKKGSFVTLFARTTKPAPAPPVSVSAKPSSAGKP